MVSPSDYLGLYATAMVSEDSHHMKELVSICHVAIINQDLYQTVSKNVRVPWPIIAAIHFRESNQKFNCHLHNGDPLSARTVHVPTGRPVEGEAPFTWTESAIDAFSAIWRPIAWDVASCLRFVEGYNGMGYQKHGVNTPYLWDYTDKYTSGLFVSDGTFSKDAKEARPGVVSILKTLEKEGVSLDFSAMGPPRVKII